MNRLFVKMEKNTENLIRWQKESPPNLLYHINMLNILIFHQNNVMLYRDDV